MNNTLDHIYMKRCLYLAQKALGKTYPNPLVGAVLVYKDQIIGEGWHHQAGSPHAEVNAISSVQDKSLLLKSTLYVNLEPCSHFGKTPPCVDIIKTYSIPRVVIGSIDPNPKVAGKGIKALKKWGCEVKSGILKKESDFLNRRFFTFHQKNRPYLILKWAQTSDYFIAPLLEKRKSNNVFWISNSNSRQEVHKWRSEEAAILVGVQTVIDDDPELTTRDWKGEDPLRLVFDPNLRTPKNCILNKDNKKTIFFNQKKVLEKNPIKKHVLLNPFELEAFFSYCYKNDIQSVIIEGGKKTLQKFIDFGYWDEARVFTSNKKLKKGVSAPNFDQNPLFNENLNGDKLNYYFN